MSIARQYAQRLLRTANVSKPPVRVEKIADSLGLKIVPTDIPNDVSGLLVTHGPISTICVQQSHALVRQRFTIAHEMGHWCLKHQNVAGPHVHVNRGHLVSARGSLAAEGTDPHEIEANQFAAELLMPRHLVKEAVERLGHRLTEDDVTMLAKEFEVSERAMDIRLRTLRLI